MAPAAAVAKKIKRKIKPMNIRPVAPSDVPQIIKLIGDVWAEYDCVLDTTVEEQYLLNPGEYFRGRDGEFWVGKKMTPSWPPPPL
jgi:hypothetical protein